MPLGSLMMEVVLAIVSIIVASTIASVYISNMNQAMDLQRLQLTKMKQEIEYDCKIVFAYSYKSSNIVKLWVKNTGVKQIPSQLITYSEIILISSDNIMYLLSGDYSSNWSYNILNDLDGDDRWDPSETLEIRLKLNETIGEGDHFIKLILFNGRLCEYAFST